jgi:hypothetical protein
MVVITVQPGLISPRRAFGPGGRPTLADFGRVRLAVDCARVRFRHLGQRPLTTDCVEEVGGLAGIVDFAMRR